MIQITIKINDKKIERKFTNLSAARQFIDNIPVQKPKKTIRTKKRTIEDLKDIIRRAKLIPKSEAMSLEQVRDLIHGRV